MKTARLILGGSTTLEALGLDRSKAGGLVCIPSQARPAVRVLYPQDDERLYDLGWETNWNRLWQMPLFPKPPPCVSSHCERRSADNECRDQFCWPKLNPVMVQRMREEERGALAAE